MKLQNKYLKIKEENYQKWYNEKIKTSLNDDLINKFVYLKPYYNEFLGELVAVIPCYNEQHKYYTCPINLDDKDPNQKLVNLDKNIKSLAPAFLYHSDLQNNNYAFDSYVGEDFKEHIKNNPWAILFQGCDDGHCGRRFSTKQEAINFLQNLKSFDDFFNNTPGYNIKDLNYAKKNNLNLSELVNGAIEFRN